MTEHHAFEVVHSGPHQFYARFIARNGEEVWRTSEVYTRRRAAWNAIALLSEIFDAPMDPALIREVTE